MDETMVERVARAIYEADDPWNVAWPWPNLKDGHTAADGYRRVARAAIEAMRDPTKAMHEAGECAPTGIGGSPPSVGNIYRTMIDAALAKGDER